MTSHSAITTREASETVVIWTFFSGINFWCKSLGRVTSKVENLYSVLQARNRSFVRRGFRRKVPFFLSSTKLPEVLQDIAFDALAPDCSIQVLEILSAIFMCVQLPGNRAFNHPTVCPKPAFRPQKNSFLWASSQLLHKLTAVVGNVLPFEALVVWRLLSKLCKHQHVCVEAQENVQQRSMTYVWKCKRTRSSVAWRMCGSARERAAA